MPQGACTPLEETDWDYVKRTFAIAQQHGLELEWLQYFAGGLYINKLDPKTAANEAATEWDF